MSRSPSLAKAYKAHSNLETCLAENCKVIWSKKRKPKLAHYIIKSIPATKTDIIRNGLTGESINKQRNHSQNISVLLYLPRTHELVSGSLDFTIKVLSFIINLLLRTVYIFVRFFRPKFETFKLQRD